MLWYVVRFIFNMIVDTGILIIHIIFTFTAYVDKGFISAILTFVLAGFSEIYWVVVKIKELGILNYYILYAIIFFVLLIIHKALKNHKKIEKE